MKKTTHIIAVLTLIAGTLACSDDPLAPRVPDEGPLGGVQRVPDAPPRPGTFKGEDGKFLPLAARAETPSPRSGWGVTDVVTFANPAHVVGSSRLDRNAGRVNVQFEAGELMAGEATTLWAVVFNNPDACVGECDDPDLFENPDTQADLMYVAGSVANARGEIQFASGIAEGDTSESIMHLFGLPGWGIIDARTAEIHLVVRSHGQAIAELRHAQTSSFNGGCTGFGAEFGTPGPNECTDLYFASHYAN